jgi:hypothetical protein
MNIETKLHEEIARELEKLEGLEVGSDKYRTTVDGITKLMGQAVEIEKIDIESRERAENMRNESCLRTQQMREERIDRLVKNILTGAGIIIPTIVTIWGTCKSIEFEKEGTITTIMGRGFINKLLPKK